MIYSLENEFITIQINDLGAELCSYFDKESRREIIWQADPAHWKRSAPILFPIIGKVFNKSYRFENTNYKLSQHGFARDEVFTVMQKTKTNIKVIRTKKKHSELSKLRDIVNHQKLC